MAIELKILKGQRSVVLANKDAAQAITRYTILESDVTAGEVIPADASTVRDNVAGIAIETIASGDALKQVAVEEINENNEYLVDVTNNSNAAHNGQLMVLTNAGVVDNTGTNAAAGIVVQTRVFGLPADKKIFVKFVKTA